MLTLNQTVWPLLDDAAVRWGFAPLDRWGAALCGALFALLVCLIVVGASKALAARRWRVQRRRLRERVLGRGHLEPG